MFTFEDLEVYKRAKKINSTTEKIALKIDSIEGLTKNQLRRAV